MIAADLMTAEELAGLDIGGAAADLTGGAGRTVAGARVLPRPTTVQEESGGEGAERCGEGERAEWLGVTWAEIGAFGGCCLTLRSGAGLDNFNAEGRVVVMGETVIRVLAGTGEGGDAAAFAQRVADVIEPLRFLARCEVQITMRTLYESRNLRVSTHQDDRLDRTFRGAGDRSRSPRSLL